MKISPKIEGRLWNCTPISRRRESAILKSVQPRWTGVSDPPATDSTAMAEPGQRVEVYPGKTVVVDFDPSVTFECVDECTWCCHHGVMLYEPDYFELAKRASLAETTTDVRGQDFVTKEPKVRDEHVGEDGEACVFLRGDGRCSLHAEHDWKPARCSVFPLSITVEDGDLHVSIREKAETHCEGLDVSERRLVDNLDAFLPELLWELENPETRRQL